MGSAGTLSSKQVLSIALREAKFSDDAHPTDIEMAVGPLEVAAKVQGPDSTHFFPTASSGPEAPGDANSIVYLVAMHGRFVYNGPAPRPRPHEAKQRPSRVLELIINANGFVEGSAWMPSVPAPLSDLGPVTQLHYAGEPHPARR
jgi:hypothetical protein